MKKTFIKRYRNESGSILILSLLITSIMSIFLFTLIRTTYNEHSLSQMEMINLQLDNIHRLATEQFIEVTVVDQSVTYDYPHGSATIRVTDKDEDTLTFQVRASISSHRKTRHYTIQKP
ncbi:hypothetical protein SAMN05421734_103289 [Pelagirhabdus alkalitolerans]|uniref:ComG operon protein 7 n=1 Tax=Pelagirhabdus alkalitolerans TaxID=1612202 RepID=A0A1G6HYW9_9BACI|nr:hypothetical protein [Pelagirhabdus alkalitolerans]SDB99348.1 hypothetical protein SAMN05421734_103289 [Pelagirhabdus alkalitolerans]